MHRSLLKTASILALSLFAFPVVAQNYSANVDPYGYGTVPLPPPQPQLQPMVMPAFQAQRAGGGYAPLNQYSSQYSSGVNYAGQATPQVVTTPQYGVVPNYLPATRVSSYGTSSTLSTPQASSVGYVVQPQQAPAGAVNVPAGSGYVQTQAYSYGSNAPAPVVGSMPQGYASAQYGAPSVNVQAPSIQAQAPSIQVPSYQAPTITAQAPSANIQTPTAYASQSYTASNSYPTPTYTAPAGSIAVAPSYDGSYQVASNAPAYQTPSYTAPSYGYQQPQVQTQGAVITQDSGQQPQVQTYAYNTPAQPTYVTQDQIYTQQPALTVQQDMGYQQTAQATPSQDVSLASESGLSPWYLAIRSGLTIPTNTSFNRAGSAWEQEFETGWQLGTAAGYEFKSFNSWLAPRAEVELVYDQQLVDSNTVAGVKTSDPNAYGFVRSLDLMANGYLDFRANRYLSPYVGAGVGVGYSDFDRLGNSATGVVMDDNDVGFVWQAMAGLGISLSNVSTVDFGYRYLQNTGLNLKASDGTVTNTEVGKHVIMVGFRNNF